METKRYQDMVMERGYSISKLLKDEFSTVYLVKDGLKREHVIKIADRNRYQRKYDETLHESLVLDDLADLPGITHKRACTMSDGLVMLVKEYKQGYLLSNNIWLIQDPARVDYLKAIVDAIHARGYVGVDINTGNIVFGHDGMMPCLIDCGGIFNRERSGMSEDIYRGTKAWDKESIDRLVWLSDQCSRYYDKKACV